MVDVFRARLTAILPCNDLDVSEAFYARLGFTQRAGDDAYRMLSDGRGGELHLTAAVEGWLIPGRNPFGLYRYTKRVDELVAAMGCAAEDKPWGCTSSRGPIPTRPSCGSGGRAGCVDDSEPAVRQPRIDNPSSIP